MINSIIESAKILGLGDSASINDINKKYKELLFKWHPDHCKENSAECKSMTAKIINAYKILMKYCYSYQFSMIKDDLVKTHFDEDPESFWKRKFGQDSSVGY